MDFANIYYCPEGYCLGPKEQPQGWSGPAASFRQCDKEGEDSVSPSVWNIYVQGGEQLDWGNMFDIEENLFKSTPETMEVQGKTLPRADCCKGKSDLADQCPVIQAQQSGCCYNIGYGSMMKPCCQNPHDSMLDATDGMITRSECPEGSRMGGATKFVEGMTCEEFENAGWTVEDNEPKGCCYNIGYASMMKECCHSAFKDQPEDGMLAKSECPVGTRMGGATKFVEGMSCTEFETKGWGMEKKDDKDKSAYSYEEYVVDLLGLEEGECTKDTGARWKKKKCVAPKEDKVKCKKFGADWCEKVGCTPPKKVKKKYKCKGTPFKTE